MFALSVINSIHDFWALKTLNLNHYLSIHDTKSILKVRNKETSRELLIQILFSKDDIIVFVLLVFGRQQKLIRVHTKLNQFKKKQIRFAIDVLGQRQ